MIIIAFFQNYSCHLRLTDLYNNLTQIYGDGPIINNNSNLIYKLILTDILRLILAIFTKI